LAWLIVTIAAAPVSATAQNQLEHDAGIALRESAAAMRANALQLERFSVEVHFDGRPRFGMHEAKLMIAPDAGYIEMVKQPADGLQQKVETIRLGKETWSVAYVFPEGRPVQVSRSNREFDARLLVSEPRWFLGMRLQSNSERSLWDLIEC
jgi:hypothetical protein